MKHELLLLTFLPLLALSTTLRAATVTGEVVDARSGRPIPARLYIQADDGRWFFAESAAPGGLDIRYEKQNWINTNAAEMHVTLSAHPFRIELPPGGYPLTAERGKEYRPLVRRVEVGTGPVPLRLPLHRWINMAGRGWFSGDTHVHRALADLPNVILAEDLNVAFPLTYWVTKAFTPPAQGDKNLAAGARAELIRVDATHLIWPRNTEWEIFTVDGRRYHLGAVFALGHKSAFTLGAPPLTPIADQARRDGRVSKGPRDLRRHCPRSALSCGRYRPIELWRPLWRFRTNSWRMACKFISPIWASSTRVFVAVALLVPLAFDNAIAQSNSGYKTFLFGVGYYPEQWPESYWEDDARRMKECGVNVVRLGEFGWALMEPREGRYDFSLFDRAIETLGRHGIKTIFGTPTATPSKWLAHNSEPVQGAAVAGKM